MHQFPDLKFWLAVAGAIVLKLLTSTWHSPMRALITVIAAVFMAWIFTDPLLEFMNWPKSYREPVAALLALTADGTIKWIIRVTPENILDTWKDFRK